MNGPRENRVGLRFVLEHAAFIQVVVPEAEACRIIQSWIGGTLKPIIGNADLVDGGWAVRTTAIIGIHKLEEMGSAQSPALNPAGSPWQPWRGGSGL